MTTSSSQDRHPSTGARFVLTRRDAENEAAPVYDVEVFLADRRHLVASLRWEESGSTVLEPPLEDAWAHAETLKLARVLRKSPKRVLSRWRAQTPT